MLTLNEKELSHALFYSLKRGDLDHAQYLLSIDAPTNTSYFLTQNQIVYTQSTSLHTQISWLELWPKPSSNSEHRTVDPNRPLTSSTPLSNRKLTSDVTASPNILITVPSEKHSDT